jgi:predicted MFS family arabinose efflux permease
MLATGLLAVVIGAGLVVASRSLALALVAFVILGLARACYDPAAQALISDMVPYERRGRAMGLIELPWSASWLIGVPVGGLLIARAGWQSVFVLVASLAAICLLLTFSIHPPAGASREPAQNLAASSPRVRAPIRFTWPMVAVLGIGGLIAYATASFFIISGAWLENQFGLPAGELGLVFGITGFAELAAELLSAGILDRVGKARGLSVGLSLNALAYVLLPRVSASLVPAMVGLTFLILTAEFSVVSVLSPLSELAPGVRGTVMAVNSASMSGAVLLASLIAPRLWELGGLALVAASCATAICCAGLILWRLPRGLIDAAA